MTEDINPILKMSEYCCSVRKTHSLFWSLDFGWMLLYTPSKKYIQSATCPLFLVREGRALCWDFYVDLLAVMFGRDRGWCHVCGRDQVCSMDKKCPMRRYAMSVLQIEMDNYFTDKHYLESNGFYECEMDEHLKSHSGKSPRCTGFHSMKLKKSEETIN